MNFSLCNRGEADEAMACCDGEREWVSNSTTATSQPYPVLPACVRSLYAQTTVADDARSDHSRRAQSSRELHTLPAYQAAQGRHVKLELRAMTNSQRSFARSVRISFAIPSPKYSWSGSPDKFVNGNTAIEGLSGRARIGFVGEVREMG